MFKFLDKIENVLVVVFIFVATILVFVNVALRAFGAGTNWSEELIRYLIIWVTFIGGSICVRKAEHVGVELLPELLKKPWMKRVLFLIVDTIVIAFLIFLLKYSVELVQFNARNGQISPAIRVPMYIVYLSVPIGAFLMIVRYIQDIVVNVKELVSGQTVAGEKR